MATRKKPARDTAIAQAEPLCTLYELRRETAMPRSPLL